MKAARALEDELRAVALHDEADAVRRLGLRLQAMRAGLSVVNPTGRLVAGS